MDETIVTKQCTKCKKDLPRTDFYASRYAKSGLSSWCKECTKAYQRKRSAKICVTTPVVTEKTCSRCGRTLPAVLFHRHRRSLDGLVSHCAECLSKRQRTDAGREIKRVAARKFAHSAKGRRYIREYSRYYRKIHVAESKARSAVSRATRDGHLPRANTQVCVQCGQAAEQYHHYLGYEHEHAINVIPLCRTCHIRQHQQPGTETTLPIQT